MEPVATVNQPRKPFLEEIVWGSVLFLFGIPIAGFLAVPYTPLHWQTLAFSIFYFCISITGITAGWCHTLETRQQS